MIYTETFLTTFTNFFHFKTSITGFIGSGKRLETNQTVYMIDRPFARSFRKSSSTSVFFFKVGFLLITESGKWFPSKISPKKYSFKKQHSDHMSLVTVDDENDILTTFVLSTPNLSQA